MANWSRTYTSNPNGGNEYTVDSQLSVDMFNVANNNAFYAIDQVNAIKASYLKSAVVSSGQLSITNEKGNTINVKFTDIGGKAYTSEGNYANRTPYIGDDGVMEIAQYIDFHSSTTDTKDNASRLTATYVEGIGGWLTCSTGFTATSFAGDGSALTNVKAKTTEKLATSRQFQIYDYDEVHSGTGVWFDGSGNVALKLASTMDFKWINTDGMYIGGKAPALKEDISSEATTRQSADETLQNNIDGLSSQVFSNTMDIEDIEKRLNDLGFKEGVVTISTLTIGSQSLIKQGNMVLFSYYGISTKGSNYVNIVIPEGFRPKEDTHIFAQVLLSSGFYTPLEIVVPTTGNIEISNASNLGTLTILNAGWRLN